MFYLKNLHRVLKTSCSLKLAMRSNSLFYVWLFPMHRVLQSTTCCIKCSFHTVPCSSVWPKPLFCIGLIPKWKPKQANTFGHWHNRYPKYIFLRNNLVTDSMRYFFHYKRPVKTKFSSKTLDTFKWFFKIGFYFEAYKNL